MTASSGLSTVLLVICSIFYITSRYNEHYKYYHNNCGNICNVISIIESGYIYSNAKMQYIKVYEEDAKVH